MCCTIYTHTGILDSINERKEKFGKERFKNLILNNKSKNIEDLLTTIFTTQKEFSQKTKQLDDITLLILKIT